MDTYKNQDAGSSAEDQFEDLMGGGLDFPEDSSPPADDTLDLTAIDDVVVVCTFSPTPNE